MEENVVQQRSLDWFRARLGYFTGSEISKLMQKSRDKNAVFGETAKSYIYQTASERLMNKDIVNDDEMFQAYIDATSVTSKAMRFGSENEDDARSFFAQKINSVVEEDGSVRHKRIDWFAASPDGIVNDDNGKHIVEIKTPKQETFIRYCCEIRDTESLKKCKPEYYWQMQAEMMCTDATDGWFVTYCPFQQDPLYYVKIEAIPEDQRDLERRIRLANEEVDTIIRKIHEKG